MASIKSYILKHRMAFLLLAAYGAVSFALLDNFPFMHSDEAWLSGLSNTIIKYGRIDMTEPFFDLYPRNPHAIKLIFVGLQTAFIGLFGHNLASMRSLSLIAGLFSLFLFYRILADRFADKYFALIFAAILAMDVQFIYASHMARQEMLLILLALSAYAYIVVKDPRTVKEYALLAAILSIGIGIHPNIFIVSIPFGMIVVHRTIHRKAGFRGLIAFISVLGGVAALFVSLSLAMDANFISNYTSYGATLGVTKGILDKILQIRFFYLKLFYQVSGTYYTPDIRLQLVMMAAGAVLGTATALKNRQNDFIVYALLGLAGTNIGYMIVGRYNQTSIVFLFPWLYLLLSELAWRASGFRMKAAGLLLAATLAISCYHVTVHPGKDYAGYLNKISDIVPADARVLSNLNTGYYFDTDRLFDYRNLAHLSENSVSFEEYVQSNGIEFILYPEEMDLIWNTRPVYNSLYGNPMAYYGQLKDFIDNKCVLEGIVMDDSYPVRIVSLMGEKEWTLRIYRVVR